jgi:NAD(P)-dependent dehydrogenase (short-subunit alcohol dehydrogenase family)
MSVPMAGAYNASKHAVVALAETLRLEVAPAVRVILVEPGAVRSEFRDTLARAMGDLPGRIKGTPFEPMLLSYLDRQRTHAASHGLSAEDCASRIADAMGRRNPPRRVPMGREAFWASLAKRLLPAAAWEWGVRRSFGLSRRQAPAPGPN